MSRLPPSSSVTQPIPPDPAAIEALVFASTAPEVERQVRYLQHYYPSLGESGAMALLADLRQKTWDRVQEGCSKEQVEFEFSPCGLWWEGADWWRKERREHEGRKRLFGHTVCDEQDGEVGLWWGAPSDDQETLVEEREADVCLVTELHAFLAAREAKATKHEQRIISDFRRALETDYETMKELADALGYHHSSIGRSFRHLLEPLLASVRLEWKSSECEKGRVRSAPPDANARPLPAAAASPKGSDHKSQRRSNTHEQHVVSNLKHRLATKQTAATASKR